jgi:hypothetical protein
MNTKTNKRGISINGKSSPTISIMCCTIKISIDLVDSSENVAEDPSRRRVMNFVICRVSNQYMTHHLINHWHLSFKNTQVSCPPNRPPTKDRKCSIILTVPDPTFNFEFKSLSQFKSLIFSNEKHFFHTDIAKIQSPNMWRQFS